MDRRVAAVRTLRSNRMPGIRRSERIIDRPAQSVRYIPGSTALIMETAPNTFTSNCWRSSSNGDSLVHNVWTTTAAATQKLAHCPSVWVASVLGTRLASPGRRGIVLTRMSRAGQMIRGSTRLHARCAGSGFWFQLGDGYPD
jgi:hypothetical protein